ncbi:hypothetical protein FFLO_06032 [Filobasidium floriforme]|uniref:Uncharacterized protein n=1 Tax=Filobasidium floriforme TaxID=5210 RepID=A0A8K0JLB8_9TREE|nr:uncharacterized protein HD553DRAFT_323252 [Filobasidium floriforme]KAG7528639.1 hypothetical protein FFLO_06032 [Filobasidium floriforme]KAH8087090.1 hypothetical protein HD553DRAFT_323252 [Filobasidium floriforme]
MRPISLIFEDPLSSYGYPRSDLETTAEEKLSSLCANWTLEGAEDLREWYSVNVDSLDMELSDLRESENKAAPSVASTDTTGGRRRRKRAEYYNTLRRLKVCIIHGVYVKGGSELDKEIGFEKRNLFEGWKTKLEEKYEDSRKVLPDDSAWKKLWNACWAARVDPRDLQGGTMFEWFCSLLEQLSSIETPEAAPEDTLFSPALENGDGAQGKADRVWLQLKGVLEPIDPPRLRNFRSSHAEAPPMSTLSVLASKADTAQPKPDWLEVADRGNAVIAAKAYKNGRKSSWGLDGISLAMVRNDLEKHKAAYEVKKKTSLRDLDLELLASACFASGKLRTLSERGFEYFSEELGVVKDAIQTPSGSSATCTAEDMGKAGKIKVD